MKTNGAQWKAYLASWPEGQWFDDSDETVNGVYAEDFVGDVPDDAAIEFTCGVVYADGNDREGVSLTTHFRRWLKAQSSVRLVCEVPKEHEEALRAFLRQHKGGVIV